MDADTLEKPAKKKEEVVNKKVYKREDLEQFIKSQIKCEKEEFLSIKHLWDVNFRVNVWKKIQNEHCLVDGHKMTRSYFMHVKTDEDNQLVMVDKSDPKKKK